MTNNPLNLDESAEWAGLWWLPEEPDKRVPSTLRYDGEGHVMLPIIGAFEDRITSNPAPSLTLYHEGVYLSHGALQIDEAPVEATTLSGMGVEWCRALYHAGKDSGRSLPSVRWKYALLQQAERMDRLCRCEREESTRGNRACSRS